jgi:arylsulfatase A-like enzyme
MRRCFLGGAAAAGLLVGALLAGCSGPQPAPVNLKPWKDMADPGLARVEEKETLSFDSASDRLDSILATGFLDDTGRRVIFSDCIWATSIVAEMKPTLLRPRDLVLVLTLRPHRAESIDPQRVQVLWNKELIGECVFEAREGWNEATFRMNVPASAQIDDENTVSFLSRFCLSAAEVGRGGSEADPRRVAFGIRRIELLQPGEKPAAPPPEAKAEEATETEVARCENGQIVQAPNTRVRFPIQLPKAARCRLRLDQAPPEGACVGAACDTLDGVNERKLNLKAENSVVESNLDDLTGQVVELVFDTTASTCVTPVIWQKPVLLIDGLAETTPTDAAKAPESRKEIAKEQVDSLPRPEVKQVVVIVLDALRASALGCEGNLRKVTPTMDALAASGITCRRAYSNATWTYPSIASYFTGLFPLQHGVITSTDLLDPELPLLQQTLQKSGVLTGSISESGYFSNVYELYRGFDEYQVLPPPQIQGEPRETAKSIPAIKDFLARHKNDRFYLHTHLLPPHVPYSTGNPFDQTVTYDPVKAIPGESTALSKAENGAISRASENVKQLRARYDENVKYADSMVAQIVDAMKELGYGKDAAVIITSDHGEEFGEHGSYGHSKTPYETQIRVPFILHLGPEASGQGFRLLRFMQSVDLYPTICGLLHAPAPAGLPGKDLFGPPPNEADETPACYAILGGEKLPSEAFVWGQWKVMVAKGRGAKSVFNLVQDPTEKSNLALLRPVLADYLFARSFQWKKRVENATPSKHGTVKLDKDTKEMLRNMGYF